MSDRRRGLGRGLGALIPAAPSEHDRPRDVFFPRDGAGSADGLHGFTGNHHGEHALRVDDVVPSHGEPDGAATARGDDSLGSVPGATFAEVPIAEIRPNPRQPREIFDEDELAELVHSIRELGVLQPVVVRRITDTADAAAEVAQDDGPTVRYELVMGERRLRASTLAGRDTIPAIIRDTDDDHMLRDALLENLHRAQLNPLEEAAAYQQLLTDFGCTHDDLARRIGRSRPQISNTIRLLKLPAMVQRRVASGVLSAGHARALLGLEDGAAMERLAQRIVAEGLSVRSVEEIVVLGTDDAPRRRTTRARSSSPQLEEMATRLSDRLETRVHVAMGRRKGKITVEFAGQEDLERILALLDDADSGT